MSAFEHGLASLADAAGMLSSVVLLVGGAQESCVPPHDIGCRVQLLWLQLPDACLSRHWHVHNVAALAHFARGHQKSQARVLGQQASVSTGVDLVVVCMLLDMARLWCTACTC